MIIRKTWSACATSFACGALALACSDVSSGGPDDSSDDTGWDGGSFDTGSTWDTDTSLDFSTTFELPGNNSSSESSSGMSSATMDTDAGSSETDSGWMSTDSTDSDSTDSDSTSSDSTSSDSTDSMSGDSTGSDSIDGGSTSGDSTESSESSSDSSESAMDGGVMDADIPTIEGDADVYTPDGGLVVRPEELAFDPLYLPQLQLPSGFDIQVFASPGGMTRMLAEHNGALYVTRPEQGDVLRLEDTNDDGVADEQTTAISGYPIIHGIVFDENLVYLATPKELIRATVGGDGSFTAPQVLIDDLPDGGQHPLRTLGIGPDGELYLSVGSSCDACPETNPERATILRVAGDGTSRTVFASGLRNTIGFGWHPETDQLWGMDHGSDWRGNDIPPEELNLIQEGNNYGWPYCYGQALLDPVIGPPLGMSHAAYCAATEPSVLDSQAHQAPIGMVFYDGDAFPASYQGDAFVAMHGSWNRSPATGYKIVRIVFNDAGQPEAVEDFVSGFLNAEGNATFGRPAGITVDSSGALIFSDDTNGVLYRVTAQ